MHLKSLELAGFKSFAKTTELEFSTPITAVVGPNGSGKSNVAEAFRFVLGEQSIKSMRGKRGEDLIWGGSPSLARAGRASVKIVLDNTTKTFPVDFDEVVVERVVNRDGTNEYLQNGARVRLRDIQELFASANIGPTGHHIISQGEADRILSATPRERKLMVEDALGLKAIQYKKAESEKKLEKTQDNIAQAESLRREVAPHLRYLERQMKKLEKARELRETLTGAYRAYLHREELYLKGAEHRLAEARIAPERELRELEAELASAKKTLAETEGDEKRDELMTLEAKLRELGTKRQEALRESGRLEGQIGILERTLTESRRGGTTAGERQVAYREVERAVGAVDAIVESALQSTDPGGLRRALESVVRTLRSFLNETTRGGGEGEEGRGHREELETLTRERERLEATLATLAADEAALRSEYDALREAIEAEVGAGREAEREVFRITARQHELTTQLEALARDERTLARDREDWKHELAEAAVLIGRGASTYRECTEDTDGVITAEATLAEERERQSARRRELEKLKIRLEELGGGGDEEIQKEYKEVSERDEFLARELEDLARSSEMLRLLIADLDAQLDERFASGIEKIDAEFNRFFVLMFGGGQAGLTRTKEPARQRRTSDIDGLLDGVDMEEEEAVYEEGVDIDVKLPNKRVRGLEMLSGGERALTSIALIFAMSQVHPPLFVILDETDAALDEANSRRYGDMIEALAKRSQLILITHNRETMSRAGVLYGVTMGADGVSKLLSVKFDEAVAVAK